MEQRFLIDSNILLEYTGHLLSVQANKFIASAINDEFNISIINRIEILGHPSADETLTAFLDWPIIWKFLMTLSYKQYYLDE